MKVRIEFPVIGADGHILVTSETDHNCAYLHVDGRLYQVNKLSLVDVGIAVRHTMSEVTPAQFHGNMADEVAVHPVQTPRRGDSKAPRVVTMRAYEVYCHLYGPQEALVTGGCRGGLSTGELIAFLYAWPFPKEEWIDRVKEARHGMENL